MTFMPDRFGGFDGGDGGAAGGADVVDDDDVRSELVEAFDEAAGAVGLFGLADEEAVDEGDRGWWLQVVARRRRWRCSRPAGRLPW